MNYTAVNHGLDEEEIAFKNSLEAQNGGDDIDELFNFSGQEELEFDTNDLDNIEMLQVHRESESVFSCGISRETTAKETLAPQHEVRNGASGDLSAIPS